MGKREYIILLKIIFFLSLSTLRTSLICQEGTITQLFDIGAALLKTSSNFNDSYQLPYLYGHFDPIFCPTDEDYRMFPLRIDWRMDYGN